MAKQNIMKQISGINGRLINRAEKARRAGNRRMEQGALAIQELAQTLAPVDEGDLEEAIVYEKRKEGTINSFYVGVDEGRPGSNGAVNVGEYAMRMHEDPTYGLGPKSSDKDLSLGGNGDGFNFGGVVGSKFLTRAFDKLVPKIEKQVKDAIKRELR